MVSEDLVNITFNISYFDQIRLPFTSLDNECSNFQCGISLNRFYDESNNQTGTYLLSAAVEDTSGNKNAAEGIFVISSFVTDVTETFGYSTEFEDEEPISGAELSFCLSTGVCTNVTTDENGSYYLPELYDVEYDVGVNYKEIKIVFDNVDFSIVDNYTHIFDIDYKIYDNKNIGGNDIFLGFGVSSENEGLFESFEEFSINYTNLSIGDINNVILLKCEDDNWDPLTLTCSGGFEEVINFEINETTQEIILIKGNFSFYIVAEEEEQIEEEEEGGGGGGGGGGFGSWTPPIQENTTNVSESIDEEITQEEFEEEGEESEENIVNQTINESEPLLDQPFVHEGLEWYHIIFSLLFIFLSVLFYFFIWPKMNKRE